MPTQERLVGTYLTSFDATSNRHLGLPLLDIIGDAAFALLPSKEHAPYSDGCKASQKLMAARRFCASLTV